MKENNIKLFEGRQIRTKWDEEIQDYYYSIIDVIAVLTESKRPEKYWSDLKSKLNKEDRQQNIQGVYSLQNERLITKQKILLVDDIYTTGSTVNECCKILQQANPKTIGVLVLAKD